jgi:glycosyltransferase involved in cell wall biosynthesis
MIKVENIQKVKKANPDGAIFSILIPSWNNLAHLQLCIESIRKNSTHKHQLIVHINEGADGTLEWAKSQPDVDFSYSKENIGVCYALNIGSTLITTNYLLYMNDDMYVCPGWDDHLYREILSIGHNYFFLSATAIEPKAQSKCSIEKSFGTCLANFDEQALLQQFATLPMQDWQGATWPPNIVHKDIWNLVGGYSIEFSPGMYSDPDFSMKLWQAGVRLFKGIEKSRVYHFGSISVKRVKHNKGYHTFIAKWGMTSGTFSKYFLKRGKPFTQPSTAPTLPRFIQLKNKYKGFISVFHN